MANNDHELKATRATPTSPGTLDIAAGVIRLTSSNGVDSPTVRIAQSRQGNLTLDVLPSERLSNNPVAYLRFLDTLRRNLQDNDPNPVFSDPVKSLLHQVDVQETINIHDPANQAYLETELRLLKLDTVESLRTHMHDNAQTLNAPAGMELRQLAAVMGEGSHPIMPPQHAQIIKGTDLFSPPRLTPLEQLIHHEVDGIPTPKPAARQPTTPIPVNRPPTAQRSILLTERDLDGLWKKGTSVLDRESVMDRAATEHGFIRTGSYDRVFQRMVVLQTEPFAQVHINSPEEAAFSEGRVNTYRASADHKGRVAVILPTNEHGAKLFSLSQATEKYGTPRNASLDFNALPHVSAAPLLESRLSLLRIVPERIHQDMNDRLAFPALDDSGSKPRPTTLERLYASYPNGERQSQPEGQQQQQQQRQQRQQQQQFKIPEDAPHAPTSASVEPSSLTVDGSQAQPHGFKVNQNHVGVGVGVATVAINAGEAAYAFLQGNMEQGLQYMQAAAANAGGQLAMHAAGKGLLLLRAGANKLPIVGAVVAGVTGVGMIGYAAYEAAHGRMDWMKFATTAASAAVGVAGGLVGFGAGEALQEGVHYGTKALVGEKNAAAHSATGELISQAYEVGEKLLHKPQAGNVLLDKHALQQLEQAGVGKLLGNHDAKITLEELRQTLVKSNTKLADMDANGDKVVTASEIAKSFLPGGRSQQR